MKIGRQTVAAVTGAGSGIGAGVARALGRRGAKVCLVDLDLARANDVASSIPDARAYPCDVSEIDAVSALAKELGEAFGRVHLLVNNAGVSVSGSSVTLPRAEFERAMNVNFWGVVNCTTSFLPLLRSALDADGEACVCNVLSDFALLSVPTKAAYTASKHAARAYTESLAGELFAEGIRVVAAYPGATATDFVAHGYAEDAEKQLREGQFLARGMSPELVGERIVQAIERAKARVLIGLDARVIDLATRLAPGLTQYLVARLWRRVPFL